MLSYIPELNCSSNRICHLFKEYVPANYKLRYHFTRDRTGSRHCQGARRRWKGLGDWMRTQLLEEVLSPLWALCPLPTQTLESGMHFTPDHSALCLCDVEGRNALSGLRDKSESLRRRRGGHPPVSSVPRLTRDLELSGSRHPSLCIIRCLREFWAPRSETSFSPYGVHFYWLVEI